MTRSDPVGSTAARGGVPTVTLVVLGVGIVALLAFTAVAVWATSHGGSDVTGWPLWQGFNPRPR